jgi:hypothetical protein
MSLDNHSDSRSFVSRYLRAPRTTAAAVLALGLGLAASSAHADEGTAPVASVAETPVAEPTANTARPLNMHDLSATSSLGLRAEGGFLTLEFFGEPVHAYIGSLDFDAELALTPNLKLLASFPVTAMQSDGAGAEGDAFAGHGNLTLGAQLQGSEGNISGALGGSFSDFADDDGGAGMFNHYSLPMFFNGGKVAHGYASARSASDQGFIQGEVSYTRVFFDRESDDDSAGFGQLTLGAGKNLDADRVVLGEVAIVRQLDEDHGENDGNLYMVDLGMRGSMGPGSKGSWGAKLSLLHADGITTLGVGFDWRTDLPGLSGE